jgi:biotin carboxyl carrier protein
MTDVLATMKGMIWQGCISTGQSVKKGQDILTMEIMKTEVPVPAPCAGVVEWIQKPGKHINRGDVVAKIKEG